MVVRPKDTCFKFEIFSSKTVLYIKINNFDELKESPSSAEDYL